jgi:hypothetical protein
MVIFCTNAISPNSAISFRKPTEKDFLGSRARKAFLQPVHEVFEDSLRLGVDGKDVEEKEGEGGILRSNETERFKAWQQQSALGHWAVMRTVLPGEIWEEW